MGTGSLNGKSGHKTRKRSSMGDGEIYRDLIERGLDRDADDPELDSARSAKSQMRLYKRMQDEEIRDIST